MRIILLAAMIGLPVSAHAWDVKADDLAYVAMCGTLFGDRELEARAFELYASTDPDSLSPDEMAEVMALEGAYEDTEDIASSPYVLAMMDEVCNVYREALTPG